MNDFRSQMFGGNRQAQSLLGAKKPRGAKATVGLQSVAVPRETCRTSDTRDSDRHRLIGEQAVVVHGRRRHSVELVNLSGGGAMVAGDFEPTLWDKVELQLADDVSVSCVIRWIKDGRFGLEFARGTRVDCTAEELENLLRDVVGRSFPEVAVDIAVPARSEPEDPSAHNHSDDNHRRADRIPLVWTGQVHFDFTSTPIRLRNISSSGALIQCTFALPVGAEPLLDLGEAGQIFATVSWRHGDQIGLSFRTPFDVSKLSRAKPAMTQSWEPPSHIADGLAITDEPGDWDHMSPDELRERLEGFLKR